MGLNASAPDRRIQFLRATLADDGFGRIETFKPHGAAVWGARQDARDAERFAAGATVATIEVRFSVRSTAFTRDIGPADRLICEGTDFDIIGIKQVGPRHQWLELSCRARAG